MGSHVGSTSQHQIHDDALEYADESTMAAASPDASLIGRVGHAISEDTYHILTSTGPTVFTQIDGGVGGTGDTGVQGDTGAASSVQGDTGIPGAKGDTGVDGETGVDGDTGAKGDTGTNKGDTGVQGDTGGAGVQGDTGVQGVDGETGVQGIQGDTGADSTVQGDTGVDGETGVQGDTGANKGDTGVAGAQGDTGIAGSGGGFGFNYLFSSNTTAPPDAAGDIEFNNATLSAVTEVYIHDTDDDSNDLDLNLDEIGVGDQIMIRSKSDSDFVVYWVDFNVDSGAYHTLTVRYINSSGGFADTEAISLSPSGSKGIFGGDSQPYVYDSNTTDGVPGDTFLRFDNASLVSVTEMYIDDHNQYLVNVNDWHESNDDSTNIPVGRVRIFLVRDPEKYGIWDITSMDNETGFWRYHLTLVNSNSSFILNDECVVTFVMSGDQGRPGGYTFDYLFSTNTSAPPDAAGDIEFDNATPASVTNVYIHDTDANGSDLDLVLDDITTSDRIRIFSGLAQDNDFVAFSVDSNTDSGTYHTFGVTYLAGLGTFADAEVIHLGIS